MDVIGRDEPGAEAEGDAGAKAENDASMTKSSGTDFEQPQAGLKGEPQGCGE